MLHDDFVGIRVFEERDAFNVFVVGRWLYFMYDVVWKI